MESIINTIGNPVDGDDHFWDRETDLALVSELLDEGNHISIIAQRRIGKTSLMRELRHRLADRYLCLSVDVQKHETPADTIAALSVETKPYQDIWGRTKDLFGNFVKTLANGVDSLSIHEVTLRLRDGLVGEDWRVKGDALLTLLAASDRPVVIFLDEVPILVNRLLKDERGQITEEGRRAADQFLSWMRENSIRHRGRLHFVLSGSIGLEPILHQAGLSATINTFAPFALEPWDKPTAVGCLHALATGKHLAYEEGVPEVMVDRLGCAIPHHVQMFFYYVYVWCKRNDQTIITQATADAVYGQDMLGARGHSELLHYEERLRMVLGPELAPLAFQLLTEAALDGLTWESAQHYYEGFAPETPLPETTLVDLLEVLQHDGYLKRDVDGRYRFVSALLCDWWQARFGMLAKAGRATC